MIETLRSGEWLDAGRVRGYLTLFALANLAVLAFLVATSHGGVDHNGFLLGTDFLSFWSEGRLLAAGSEPYDAAAHIALQRELYPSATGYTAFFYPPAFLPFVRPLGALDYFSALGIWLILTGGSYAAAVRAWWPEGPPLRFALAMAAFPAALLVVTHGQTAFLVAALLGGGALLLARGRANWAGLLFGLATIKPQLGLMVPVVLLASRQWRAVAAAAATAAILAALTTLWFDPAIWRGWLAATRTAETALASGAIGFAKLVSPFAALRLLGLGATPAYAIQGIVTLAIAGALGLAAWRCGFTRGVGAAMLAAAPLATPFVLDYDLVLLAFPLAWLATQPARPWERTVGAVAFALPAFARPLALASGIQVAPLVLLAFFALVVARASGATPETEKGAA